MSGKAGAVMGHGGVVGGGGGGGSMTISSPGGGFVFYIGGTSVAFICHEDPRDAHQHRGTEDFLRKVMVCPTPVEIVGGNLHGETTVRSMLPGYRRFEHAGRSVWVPDEWRVGDELVEIAKHRIFVRAP